MKIKKIEEKFFMGLMAISTYSIILTLIFILLVILVKGVHSLTWEMILHVPKGGFYFGKEGGILNAIIGSFYLAVGSTFLALIISLPVALFMNVYLIKYQNLLNQIRFLMDVLWGVPSIVYGAFGFALMIYAGMRASLFAGIITVALLIMPIMVRSMDEVIRTIPSGLLEASSALGSTRSEISFKIFIRQASPGIITAILLAFGRGIGDAASVLFTTGYSDYLPNSINQPVATLPLAIFFQLSSPIPEVQARAYASALVLTTIILIISIIARVISKRYKEHIIC
jgi:phosphate transport system permease protein